MLLTLEPSTNLVAILGSVEDSVNWLKQNPEPELIFMDIQLEDGQSFEIFNQVNISSHIIFITAFDEYAIKAFKFNSIDYLLKPLKEMELKLALDKYRSLERAKPGNLFDYQKLAKTITSNFSEKPKRIMVHMGSQLRIIEIKSISYVYTRNKIVYAVTKDGKKVPIDYTLDHFEEMLNPESFFRINRQFIVSISAIDQMHVYSKSRVKLILKPVCKEETIVSTERSPHFKKWITGSSTG